MIIFFYFPAAKQEMVKSKLPNNILGRIWKLSDVDKVKDFQQQKRLFIFVNRFGCKNWKKTNWGIQFGCLDLWINKDSLGSRYQYILASVYMDRTNVLSPTRRFNIVYSMLLRQSGINWIQIIISVFFSGRNVGCGRVRVGHAPGQHQSWRPRLAVRIADPLDPALKERILIHFEKTFLKYFV